MQHDFHHYKYIHIPCIVTEMNEDSSRSHLVVGVIIESVNLTSGAITRGKLSLVDLAGSERVAKTGATADQLKVWVNFLGVLCFLTNLFSGSKLY